MNLREGTRRLALLLGVVGAILGGFAANSKLQSFKEQRASYNRFARLAASPVVQQARRSIETTCANDPYAKPCADATHNAMSEVYSGGIKTIYWTNDYQASLIQTDDGEDLFSALNPSAWPYLWVPLLCIALGFFIPWGAVRAAGWVIAGFAASPK